MLTSRYWLELQRSFCYRFNICIQVSSNRIYALPTDKELWIFWKSYKPFLFPYLFDLYEISENLWKFKFQKISNIFRKNFLTISEKHQPVWFYKRFITLWRMHAIGVRHEKFSTKQYQTCVIFLPHRGHFIILKRFFASAAQVTPKLFLVARWPPEIVKETDELEMRILCKPGATLSEIICSDELPLRHYKGVRWFLESQETFLHRFIILSTQFAVSVW